jgi:thiamine-monophosphate kinase
VTQRRLPQEFELIATMFAPLAEGNPGALGLRDDAALIDCAPGNIAVVTVDALVGGVHFMPGDPADLVARKLLRVNLSDLAAMGAEARVYFMAISLTAEIDTEWIEAFVAGLAADQDEFGVHLAGGDLTTTPGPLTLSVTAMGEVPKGRELRRSGAAPGEDIYVSGTFGDAALGLALLQGALAGKTAAEYPALVGRYHLPLPRLALGAALRGIATAAADVSDGLVADLGHICEASAVGAEIDAHRVPVSQAAREMLAAGAATLETVLCGGDDYELVFTAAPASAADLARIASELEIPLCRIGRCVAGSGVAVADAAGTPMTLRRSGWRHF